MKKEFEASFEGAIGFIIGWGLCIILTVIAHAWKEGDMRNEFEQAYQAKLVVERQEIADSLKVDYLYRRALLDTLATR